MKNEFITIEKSIINNIVNSLPMPNLNKNNMHNAVIKRGVLSCFQIIKNFLLLKLSSKRKNDGIREKCIKIEKIPKKEEKYSF